MLKNISDLISSLASLGWVVLAFIAFFTFKNQIVNLFPRMKKIKIGGQEIELDKAIEKIEEISIKSSQEIPIKPEDNKKEKANQLLELSDNPRMAVIKVGIEIENTIKSLYASLGMLKESKYIASSLALRLMTEKGYIPTYTYNTLQLFRQMRSQIIHRSDSVDDKEVLRFLEVGINLLNVLKSIPHTINVVEESDIDLYSDEKCENIITDAKGVILNMRPSGTQNSISNIFPTYKVGYYKKGKVVAWEWDLTKVWNAVWYINPKTKKSTKAWDSSGAFIGRNVDDL